MNRDPSPAMETQDNTLLHRIQVGAEMRKEWTAANYAATYLNANVPADARFECFKAAQGGCLS
jgi:hypothetical protein